MTTYLFMHKSNKIKIGMNEMTVNDSEMSMRWNNEAWSIPEKSVLRLPRWKLTKEEKDSKRHGFLTF